MIPTPIYQAIIASCAVLMGFAVGTTIVVLALYKSEPAPKDEQIL